jgi:polyphosphate glucokinase
MVCDSVLLGGGNAKFMKDLPNHIILGANTNAIDGGLKLWEDVPGTTKPSSSQKPARSAR